MYLFLVPSIKFDSVAIRAGVPTSKMRRPWGVPNSNPNCA